MIILIQLFLEKVSTRKIKIKIWKLIKVLQRLSVNSGSIVWFSLKLKPKTGEVK